jgi:biofilm PGA synthesis protein PgaD
MPEIEIRDNPRLKRFLRTITEVGFTGIMWGLWIYLFLPLLNIVLWLLGIRYFHIEVIEHIGYKEFIGLLHNMGWIVLVVFIILRLWGYYNYMRFGRNDRRRRTPSITTEQLAGYFNIPIEEVENLQSKKEIVWY